MPDFASEITDLVEAIVVPLIDFPDDFELTTYEEDNGDVLVEIRVNEEDAGKVIGRQGRVIKSIRTLARAAASREDRSVEVELID